MTLKIINQSSQTKILLNSTRNCPLFLMINLYSKIVITVSHPNKHLPNGLQSQPAVTRAVAQLKPIIHSIWLSEAKYGMFFSWEEGKNKSVNFLLAH